MAKVYFMLLIVIAAAFGFIANLFFAVKYVIGLDAASITLAEISTIFVLQVVGVFVPPLGVVMGYLVLLM